MAERLLEVSNLVKHFPMGRRQTVKAINDVSFHIDRGETLALVGESGSGKTTVGRCILRLIEPTEGRITFAGAQVDTMSANQLRALRPRVQMVFQEPYDSLNPRMRIRKIVEEPILLGGDMTPAQRHDRVAEVLDSSSTVGKLNLLGINKLIGAENPCHYIPVRDAILHDSAYEPGSVFPSSILI